MKKLKNKMQHNTKKEVSEKNESLKNTDKDFRQIHDLVQLITQHGIAEISFEKKDYKLTIKQMPANIRINENNISETAIPIQSSASTPPVPTPTAPPPPTPNLPPSEKTDIITIKSPIIGTFYRKPSPESANFVDVGTVIEKGKVLCIIEAMKLFNEIESEVNGKIIEVLIEDGTPVEFDQPLFLVELK